MLSTLLQIMMHLQCTRIKDTTNIDNVSLTTHPYSTEYNPHNQTLRDHNGDPSDPDGTGGSEERGIRRVWLYTIDHHQPPLDHPSKTYPNPNVHLSNTHRLLNVHLSNTHRLLNVHLSTTHRLLNVHLSNIRRLLNGHLSTTRSISSRKHHEVRGRSLRCGRGLWGALPPRVIGSCLSLFYVGVTSSPLQVTSINLLAS